MVFRAALALLRLVAHVARPIEGLIALGWQVPTDEPQPPALGALPGVPTEDLEARVRAGVPSTHVMTCRACGGTKGREVAERTCSEGSLKWPRSRAIRRR
jgi:hypothetical protein